MTRLPNPGGDNDIWGNLLNDFLNVEHNGDGTLKNVARPADLVPKLNKSGDTMTGPLTLSGNPSSNLHAATKQYVDSTAGAGAADATTTTKGVVQLAGDLAGTAAAPTVPGLASKVSSVTAADTTVTVGGTATAPTVKVNSITESQVTNLTTDLSGKTDKSTLTTKGDLYVASGASTPARLGAGTDGQVLTADSAQSTGLKWASAPSDPLSLKIASNLSDVASTQTARANLLAAESTTGSGLPGFSGRVAGDLHFDTSANKEYVLTGVAGALQNDSFSRADGNLVGTTTESGSKTWANSEGPSGGDTPIISGGKVRPRNGAFANTAYFDTGVTGSRSISADITMGNGPTDNQRIVVVADTSLFTPSNQIIVDIYKDSIYVKKEVSGTWSNLGSSPAYTFPVALSTGDTAFYEVDYNVSTGDITVSRNNSVLVTVNDPSPGLFASAYTFVGLGVSDVGLTVGAFDNFQTQGFGTLAWIQVADAVGTGAGKVDKSVLTTKGDIIVATAANTPARHGVGSDGQILMADSTQADGIKWAAVPGTIENVNTVASSGGAQTIPDVTVDTVSYITLTANCTLTFPTAAAGKSFTIILVQDATGSRTVSWPGTVKWAGNVAPVLSTGAGKTDVFSFMCADGTNWLGFIAGQTY
ncbi:MAG TPA: hypothetical protein VHB51_00615 [Candidatus Saccharimonadales bacterium]|nr:hypothetical protein [Candidatus Saccharimonadales bacterium]